MLLVKDIVSVKIIINFIAGASVTDFLLAYTIHGSFILLIEVILLMVTVFAVLGVCLWCLCNVIVSCI